MKPMYHPDIIMTTKTIRYKEGYYCYQCGKCIDGKIDKECNFLCNSCVGIIAPNRKMFCVKCGIKKPTIEFELDKYWCKDCASFPITYWPDVIENSKSNKACIKHHMLHIRAKMKVIKFYSKGTNKCSCCGESNLEFLSLHHVNNGNRHRAIIGITGGYTFYKWLIKKGYPNSPPYELTVLCMNCSAGTHSFGGCPHKNKREVKT